MFRCTRRKLKCAPRSRSSPIRNAARRAAGARRRRAVARLAQARWSRAAGGQLRRDAGQPHHPAAAERPVHAGDRDAGRSDRQHPALGALSLERHLLHAMRSRRFPPHHLFSRPARRDGGLHHAHRGRQSRSAGAAVERQSDRERRLARTAGISRSGTIRIRSRLICSHWSAAISAHVEDHFRTMSGREVVLRIYVEPGKEGRCGYAMDSLKRSMRWDEQAFGREYDLDIFMIVAVSDFNMGAMENKGLNVFNDKYVLASVGHRDRHRFRADRGRDRARIFPQLDRQPHHLPRLVPALPEGRPHGFPRSGIFLRHALARGEAHFRRAQACAPRSSSRTQAPWRIRFGRRYTRRSTTSTPAPFTKKAPKWCAWCRL